MSLLTTAAPTVTHETAPRLPSQYGAALELADAMLDAARESDWETVANLRTRIPALAGELRDAWSGQAGMEPELRRRLERERIRAIRRILSVDDQIRRLADPRGSRLQDWILAGGRHQSAAADAER